MTAQAQKIRLPQMKVWKAILLALPMLLLTGMLVMGPILSSGVTDAILVPVALLFWLGLNVMFFFMLRSGKTYKLRAAIFIPMAIGFIISFASIILGERGNIALTEANMIQGQTPFCHLVIPMVIIPAIFTRTIIFPGSMLVGFASIATMLMLWVGATLALGRAWCSWGCFYGGLDEGFSLIARRPVIRKINRKWTYLPYAVLLGVVLVSAVTLGPTYCEWLCPFKAVTEFPAVTSTLIFFQTIIFVSLFLGLVVVLPILTRRRIQCGLFCPFGAMQSFTNKVNVFDVRIDAEKCNDCGLCIRSCPTFSLDENSAKNGHPSMTCTRCGKCIDNCPRGAITWAIKGTSRHANPTTARVLFLYPAFLLLATFGGQMIIGGVWRLINFFVTGSLV